MVTEYGSCAKGSCKSKAEQITLRVEAGPGPRAVAADYHTKCRWAASGGGIEPGTRASWIDP